MICPTCRSVVERVHANGEALSVPCPDCGRFGDERDAKLDTAGCECIFPLKPAVQHQWGCPVRERFERARFAEQTFIASLAADAAVRILASCKHPISERVVLGRHLDGVRAVAFCDACGVVFLGDEELLGQAVATLREEAAPQSDRQAH
jgi:hypothetical protein